MEDELAKTKLVKKMKKFIAEAFNYEDAMIARQVTQDEVDNLRQMLVSCDFFPKATPDKALLLLLIACQNDPDKCLNLTRNFLKFSRETPEFLANRDVNSKEVQACLKNQVYVSLPPTRDNCNLILLKFSNCDPKTYDFDAAVKTFLMATGKQLAFRNP